MTAMKIGTSTKFCATCQHVLDAANESCDDGRVKRSTNIQTRILGQVLQLTLARIEAGVLVARPETRARIEGALTACRVLSGDDPDDIVTALQFPEL